MSRATGSAGVNREEGRESPWSRSDLPGEQGRATAAAPRWKPERCPGRTDWPEGLVRRDRGRRRNRGEYAAAVASYATTGLAYTNDSTGGMRADDGHRVAAGKRGCLRCHASRGLNVNATPFMQ